MYLGPFQGKVACTRIPFSKGVCGHAATIKKPVVVRNVSEFPGHICCDGSSVSEIVIPIIADPNSTLTSPNKSGEPCVIGVLDIDATVEGTFNETIDAVWLEKIVKLLQTNLWTIKK